MGVKPHPRFIETGIVALLARKKVRHSSLEFAQQLRDLISHRSFLQRRRLVFRLKSRGQKLFRKATFHVDLGALNGELIAVRRLSGGTSDGAALPDRGGAAAGTSFEIESAPTTPWRR
jgi:hypothetical protein